MRHLSILVLGLALAACQDGAASKKADDTATEGGKDDPPKPGPDDVEDAIPMALFDGSLLAQYAEKALEGQGYAALPPRATEAQFIAAATTSDKIDFTFSKETIALPDRAERQLLAVTREVETLLSKLYGTGGAFRGADLKIKTKDGKGRAVFKIPSGDPAGYVVVDVDQGRDLPYGADLFTASGATFVRTMRVEARRDATGRRAHVDYLVSPADPTLQGHLAIDYDETKRSVATTLRYTARSAARPAATHLRAFDDPTRGERLVQGAILWDFDPPAAAPTIDPPRYYAPKPGDVELFQALRALNKVGATAQAAVFVRAEEKGAGTARDYVKIMLDHLTAVTRHEGVNARCTELGDLLRAAFAAESEPAPAAVQSLPANACRMTAGVTDDAVSKAIAASCDAGLALAIDVTFSDVGAKRYYLCNKYWEAGLLANPIYSTLAEDQTRKVTIGADTTKAKTTADNAAQADLGTRLEATGWLDPAVLNPAAVPFTTPELTAEDQAAAGAPP